MELVVLSSTDDENGQVAGLIKKGEWEKVILIKGDLDQPLTGIHADVIMIDRKAKLLEMREELRKKLRGKIGGIEVALSIASGNGKEHMALISALLSLPVGIRFTALTKEGIVQL